MSRSTSSRRWLAAAIAAAVAALVLKAAWVQKKFIGTSGRE